MPSRFAHNNKFDILYVSDSDIDAEDDYTLCISNISYTSFIEDVFCYGIAIIYVFTTFYLFFSNLFLVFSIFILFACWLRKHFN